MYHLEYLITLRHAIRFKLILETTQDRKHKKTFPAFLTVDSFFQGISIITITHIR